MGSNAKYTQELRNRWSSFAIKLKATDGYISKLISQPLLLLMKYSSDLIIFKAQQHQ